MSFSELMCNYVYNSFLLLEGSLEVAMRMAASFVNMINSLVDSILYTFKYVIDVALKTMLDALKVAQKTLLDYLWNRIRPDAFCANLYKCSIILEDLADENSLIWKTCVKAGIIKGENADAKRQAIYDIINDYNNFKATICEYGFTTSFGVETMQKIVDYLLEQTETFFNYLMKKKDAFRRAVQKFLDDIENLGIFDLFDKLRKYFNCILDSSEECAHIRSASNYYASALAKLHLEESGSGGYRLETSLNNKILNGFDARITQVNNIKGQVNTLSEMLVNPNDAASANKAYDLSKNVFPGNMTWSDIKNARMLRRSTFVDTWKKTGIVKYITINYDRLFKKIYDESADNKPEYISTDYMMAHIIINDNDDTVTVDIDENTSNTYSVDGSIIKKNELLLGEFDVNIDNDNIADYMHPVYLDGQGMSILAAGSMMALQPDSDISKALTVKAKNIYERFPNTIPESELVTAWG